MKCRLVAHGFHPVSFNASCNNKVYYIAGKITVSQNTNCKEILIDHSSECFNIIDNSGCGGINRTPRLPFTVNPMYTCGSSDECGTNLYYWSACGNPPPPGYVRGLPLSYTVDSDFDIDNPATFDLLCEFMDIYPSCCGQDIIECIGSQSGFKFTSKRIYINNNDSICVPVYENKFDILNNLEDCES